MFKMFSGNKSKKSTNANNSYKPKISIKGLLGLRKGSANLLLSPNNLNKSLANKNSRRTSKFESVTLDGIENLLYQQKELLDPKTGAHFQLELRESMVPNILADAKRTSKNDYENYMNMIAKTQEKEQARLNNMQRITRFENVLQQRLRALENEYPKQPTQQQVKEYNKLILTLKNNMTKFRKHKNKLV